MTNVVNRYKTLASAMQSMACNRWFVVVDEQTRDACLPLVAADLQFPIFVLPAGESAKTLDVLALLWDWLDKANASRDDALICLGGGAVCDVGGLAAATFKRGMRVLNVPTTLLSMTDAAWGGKTAINFNGKKNLIGVIRHPDGVVIDLRFLQTLNAEQLSDGLAEMLKHGLIGDRKLWTALLSGGVDAIDESLLWQSISVKERFVAQDVCDLNLRHALNFGHTFAHAFEALARERQQHLSHGTAVAWGMVCALYLSVVECAFPVDDMRQTLQFIQENFHPATIECKDYDRLLQLMHSDKKNVQNQIRLVVLKSIEQPLIDWQTTEEAIKEAFDFLREGV